MNTPRALIAIRQSLVFACILAIDCNTANCDSGRAIPTDSIYASDAVEESVFLSSPTKEHKREDFSLVSGLVGSQHESPMANWDGLLDRSIAGNDPVRGIYGFFGYDSWRGYPDGGWTNNGMHAGANAAVRLGRLSDLTGIGFQIGGSVGVYDFGGTDYRFAKQDMPTTQGFVTYGLFHRMHPDSRYSAAVVQDWMINDTYSVWAEDSVLSQIRTQAGFRVNDANELGVWGAWRVKSDTRKVGGFIPVTWQPHNQLNAYWHYRWPTSGVDSWIWVGVPERKRLDGDGSLGDYIAGAFASCPLSDRFSLYTTVSYMHQSARPGPDAAKEEAWNFFSGVSFYLRPIARSNSIGGRRWLPLLPVANNGSFFVDASRTY